LGAARKLEHNLHRFLTGFRLVDDDSIGLSVGNKLIQVMVQVGYRVGAHGMGALAKGVSLFGQGGKSQVQRIQPALGVAIQSRLKDGII
jgi:hypothetical protein